MRYSAAGKRTFEYAGNKLSKAKGIDDERRVEKRAGKLPQYAKKTVMLFNDYVDSVFTPHFEAKNKSPDKPRYMIRHFREFFYGVDIASIKPVDIEKAVWAGSDGKSSTSFNYYLAIIKRMFNYAIELDLLEKSPVRMKKSKRDDRRMRFLTREEQDRLMVACKESKTKYLYEMVYVALYTVMRLGEIQAIVPEDVRDDCIYVRSDTAKNLQGRAIPLTDEVAAFFRKASYDWNHDIKNSDPVYNFV